MRQNGTTDVEGKITKVKLDIINRCLNLNLIVKNQLEIQSVSNTADFNSIKKFLNIVIYYDFDHV
jgi:hypothetical protein